MHLVNIPRLSVYRVYSFNKLIDQGYSVVFSGVERTLGFFGTSQSPNNA
jgi:hypothetical protein